LQGFEIRGACNFTEKVKNIQLKGYAGAIMINLEGNDENAGAAGGSDPTITIPGIGISYYAALRLINPTLVAGVTVPLPFSFYQRLTGTAQGGSTTTIQLAANTPSVTPALVVVGQQLFITSGTGRGQSRLITAYDEATKTATLSPALTIAPDATSVYRVPLLQPLPNNCAGNPYPCGVLANTGIVASSGFIKSSHFRVWDIKNADKEAPVLVSTIDTNCTNRPGDIVCQGAGTAYRASYPQFVDNNTLVASWFSGGISLIDLSNPATPTELARWNPEIDPAFVAQNSGAPQAAFVIEYDKASGCYFVLDQNGGLYVLDDLLSGPRCNKVN
jgi:hypothetical protein